MQHYYTFEDRTLKKKKIQETHHHVSITDCFYFVHIIPLDDPVKQCVQVIQEIHHL
jgi:hypothetical protein